jgi:hypothetical protein
MGGKAGIYGVLALIGFVVPVVFGAKFIAMYGLDFGVMADQVTGTLASKIVVLDIFLSSLVAWIWMAREGGKEGMTWWYYIPLTLIIGLCFALPLFLFNRERAATS